MRASRIALVAAFAVIMFSVAASAQPQRPGKGGQGPGPTQQTPQGGGAQGAGAGVCAPSGFARLTRNCSQNVGNCQRMPDSCNRGWCCP
jgi:hypothetical protein